MGVNPVGVVDWFGERPYGNFPWTSSLWGGTQPEIVGERGDFNFEKIAALKPHWFTALEALVAAADPEKRNTR